MLLILANWAEINYFWFFCLDLCCACGCVGLYCVCLGSLPSNRNLAGEACLSEVPRLLCTLVPVLLLFPCLSSFCLSFSPCSDCPWCIWCFAFEGIRVHRTIVPSMVNAATPYSALWLVIADMQFLKWTSLLIPGTSVDIIKLGAWELDVIVCDGLGGFIEYAVWCDAQLLC